MKSATTCILNDAYDQKLLIHVVGFLVDHSQNIFMEPVEVRLKTTTLGLSFWGSTDHNLHPRMSLPSKEDRSTTNHTST